VTGTFIIAAVGRCFVKYQDFAGPEREASYRLPSLLLAPYMHNDRVTDLDAVIDFYSELNKERLDTDGERKLRPLSLTPSEKADIKAFLGSLSASCSELDRGQNRGIAACDAN